MTRKKSAARPARTGRPAPAGASMLAAALAVELVDELVDGTKAAAFPLIRHDLALSYGQIGLLASVPLLLGSLLLLLLVVVWAASKIVAALDHILSPPVTYQVKPAPIG